MVNLIRPEWIDFGIFTLIGASLLINPRNSATAKIMQIALTIVAVNLLVTNEQSKIEIDDKAEKTTNSYHRFGVMAGDEQAISNCTLFSSSSGRHYAIEQ